MVTSRSVPFALTQWDFTKSALMLQKFLPTLRRTELAETYNAFGGLALSYALARELVDGYHFESVPTTWTTCDVLRLPQKGDIVALAPSTAQSHWLQGQHENGARTFAREDREAMLVHMIHHGHRMWLARQFIEGTPVDVDVYFDPEVKQSVVRFSESGRVKTIVTLHDGPVLDRSFRTYVRYSDPRFIADYLCNALPRLGVTFAVRIRCVVTPSNAWHAINLRPLPPEEVMRLIRR